MSLRRLRPWLTNREAPDINLQIDVPPEWQTGVYANFAAVSTQAPFDVTLDFCQLIPGEGNELPRARVVARLKLASSFLMPLMQVLSSHALQHEEQVKRAEGGQGPP
jgi:hypothetical protein